MSIQDIEGNGVRLKNITLHFNSLFERSAYRIEIDSVTLPEEYGVVEDIVLRCHLGIVSKQEIACEEGEISFHESFVSAEQARLEFSRKENGDLKASLKELNFADGSVTVMLDRQDSNWHVELYAEHLSFAGLKTLPSFPEWITSGSLTGTASFTGVRDALQHINGDVHINALEFANQESTLVGEGVAAKLRFSGEPHADQWEVHLNSSTYEGELYIDPIFLDANESAKDLHGTIEWQFGSQYIRLQDFHIEDSHAMHVQLTTGIDIEKKTMEEPIRLKVNYAIFPDTYTGYIQPFLLDTNAADLVTEGRLEGEVIVDGSKVAQADLNFDQLSLADRQDRFSITNLNGKIGWGSEHVNKKYSFGFELAALYTFRFGKSQFTFLDRKDAWVLSEPAEIPWLDGGINIGSFQVNDPGREEQSISMDIGLAPISMSKVSSALGWPVMHGKLAGNALGVRYRKGEIKVGGELLMEGFGGTTTIRNLYAEDLFGVAPRLSADITLEQLDLNALTETFSFGEITGKLSGTIKDLKFVRWMPVQFDAWLGTPEKDQSAHRISQAAVDNLTEIGQGASNILSKGFLRFFDSFGYDKLGLGCVLKNNICKMRGLSKEGHEFYIVKGRGVPRINIVGFNDEVSWPVLITRLKRAVKAQDIIVE